MKAALLFLVCALGCRLAAAVTSVPGATTTAAVTATVPSVWHYDAPNPANPDEVFSWTTTSLTPAFGIKPGLSAPTLGDPSMTLWFSAELAANPSAGGDTWLHIPSGTGFGQATCFNLNNSPQWGRLFGKGQVSFAWMYSGVLNNNRVLFFLNAKTNPNPSAYYDNQNAVALLHASDGLIFGANKLYFYEQSAGMIFKTTYRWNRMLKNPTGTRTQVVYVEYPNGSIQSSWQSNVINLVGTNPPWGETPHMVLVGEDSGNQQEKWYKDFRIQRGWNYDLPANIWQDFEFTGTFDETALQGRDHHPTQVWVKSGTLSAWSTPTAAQMTLPSTVNLQTDTGTRGARCDLSITAQQWFGWALPAPSSTVQTAGGMLRPAALANNTVAHCFYAGGTPGGGAEELLTIQQWNDAGQQKLRLISPKLGYAVSSAINVTAGTLYNYTLRYERNVVNGGVLQVRSATGTLLGEVSMNCPNNNISAWYVGCSADPRTAQAGGVFYEIDNLYFDTAVVPYWPLIPWENPNL